MFYILFMEHNNILGTVLAGGKSQRFGEDKSQILLADKILIDYILAEIIDEFKVNAEFRNITVKFLNQQYNQMSNQSALLRESMSTSL